MVITAKGVKMKFEYILITFLMGMCAVLVILILIVFKSVQSNPVLIKNPEINEIYEDRDFILDYEKTNGIIYEPRTGKLKILERPEKGKAWLMQYRDGYVFNYQIDSPETNKKYYLGVWCENWGSMVIDPEDWQIKYFLYSSTREVSANEFEFEREKRKHEKKDIDIFCGGIQFGTWGAIMVDPDDYSLKFYLLYSAPRQVSEKEYKKAQSERER
jgi:hypothetical protein